MKRSRTIVGLLAVALVLTLAGAAQAAITYFGADIDTTAGAWRTAANSAYDADGGTEYGTDGYFIGWTTTSGAFNPPLANLESTPSYVSSIAWDAAVWTYDGTGDGVMNFIDTPGGGPAAAYGCGLRADPYTPDGVVISFTLSEAASFRLGAFNDMFDAGWGSHQNYVIDDRIELQLNAEPVVATPGASLAFNGIYDYYFFDISGQAGDVVTVSAFRQDDGPLGTFLKGIVFDSPAPIPEPATISLLVIGAMGLIARRKHR